LEPFAELGADYAQTMPDHEMVFVTVGELRAAARALASLAKDS
jgi:hypothetical protein